jgi:hypothetical protein
MTDNGTKDLVSLTETTRIQSIVYDKVDLSIDGNRNKYLQSADIVHSASLIDTVRSFTGNESLRRTDEYSMELMKPEFSNPHINTYHCLLQNTREDLTIKASAQRASSPKPSLP